MTGGASEGGAVIPKAPPWLTGADARAFRRGEVRIADLLCVPRFQVRHKLDGGTIDRYMGAYLSQCLMPPVAAALLPGGALVLIDGWHRVEALRRLGRETVEATIQEASEREARWLAARANLTHGLPLKGSELRKVFRAYVTTRQHYDNEGYLKSYRDIAQDLGGARSHVTIRAWMMKDFPKVARLYGQERGQGAEGAPAGELGATLLDTARHAIDQALAASRGITDPADRGELIAEAEALLERLKAGGEWTPWQPY